MKPDEHAVGILRRTSEVARARPRGALPAHRAEPAAALSRACPEGRPVRIAGRGLPVLFAE
ncbi:hypothetical protein [Streptomyces tsukubensis]|uniref:Uncharacterized protein n=1 Tax=Streptomyces tsukubensis TaxID=83656 RepID=A0A1V4A813_9ACTN|nr:hypothetical protein [Streptomyces tsukubensis]OON77696.1 hypothetical protein B1H18_18425 [Streptomyces tsukubensis]QFR93208.1 hypothetical protein GBW32_09060 [Streptomyces tsukubensis]